MYIHLGNDCSIRSRNIISILDMDNATLSKNTREFFKVAEEEGFIEAVSDDIPKSAVICEIDNKSKIYLCPVASSTIRKRISEGLKSDVDFKI